MIIFACISAILLYLAFPNSIDPFGFPLFAYIFAFPLFICLENKRILPRFCAGLIFALLFYGLLVKWFWPYSRFGYFVFVALLSIPQILFSVSCRIDPDKRNQLLFVPVLWVLCEGIRTLYFKGFAWDVGYSQVFALGALKIAGVLGSIGVAYLVLLVNCLLYRSLRRSRYKAAIFLVLCSGCFFFPGQREPAAIIANSAEEQQEVLTVCSVQPAVDPYEKIKIEYIEEIINKNIGLTKQCFAEQHPQLVIWPETAVPVDFLADPELKTRITSIARKFQTSLLVGAALGDEEKYFNSAVLINADGEVSQIYRKRSLIPFSEFVPAGKFWSGVNRYFGSGGYGFSAGQEAKIFRLAVGVEEKAFGVFICSEETQARYWREYSKAGVDFVVVLLNDGWFQAKEALILHAQNGIMQSAVWGIPLVRSANTGWTIIVDGAGSFRDKDITALNKEEVFVYNINLRQKKNSLLPGVLILMLFCCVCVGIFIIKNYKERKRDHAC